LKVEGRQCVIVHSNTTLFMPITDEGGQCVVVHYNTTIFMTITIEG